MRHNISHFPPNSGGNTTHKIMLGGETQRRTFPRYQSEEMKILTTPFSQLGIELTTCRVYSHTLAPLCHDRLQQKNETHQPI